MGFESVEEEGLKQVRKNHNLGLDYKEIIAKLHDHNLAVIASTIFGLDSHSKDYPRQLIKAMKKARVDFPRVFFATAWPGTPFFESLEKEGRVSRNWDEVRKDAPSIQFKHFTSEEALAGRKEVVDAFFNFFSMLRVISRWVFKDRTLIFTYLKMNIRNRISERIMRRRKYGDGDGEYSFSSNSQPKTAGQRVEYLADDTGLREAPARHLAHPDRVNPVAPF